MTTKDHCKFREARRSPLDANPMKTHDTPMKQEGMEAKPRKYNIHCLYTSQLTTHIHNHAWCPVFMVDLEITRGGNQYSHLPEVLRKKKKANDSKLDPVSLLDCENYFIVQIHMYIYNIFRSNLNNAGI